MWTANLDEVTKNDGNVVAKVTFTSDKGEKIVQDIPSNSLTPDTLATFVGNRIQAFEARDLAFQTLVPGPITPPQKTVDQQAQLDTLAALAEQVASAQPATPIP
jgi:hypothetical protein